VRVVVDVLVPEVNASNGVFIAARVDQAGCQTFLARGIFFFLLFGHCQVVIATDLGQYCFVCPVSDCTFVTNTVFEIVVFRLQIFLAKFSATF